MADLSEPELQRMRQVLERAVRRSCPARFADHRQDIVQAALLKVVEIHRRGEAAAVVKASYLWQVAFTASVDEIRRIARRKEVSMNASDPAVDLQPVAPDDVARRALGGEIRDCLERLIEPRRIAAVLSLSGFGSEEAARAVGWSVKRMRNLIFRGIGDLRRCLELKGVRP